MEREEIERRVQSFTESIQSSVKGGYNEQTMQQAVWDFVKSFNVQLPYNTAHEFWNGPVTNSSWSNNDWNNWSNNSSWNQWANGANYGGFNFKKRSAKKEDDVKTDDGSKQGRSEKKNRSRKKDRQSEE